MFLLFFRLIYSLYFILDISKVYFVELGKYSCVCVCVRECRRNHNLRGILEVGSDKKSVYARVDIRRRLGGLCLNALCLERTLCGCSLLACLKSCICVKKSDNEPAKERNDYRYKRLGERTGE